MLLDHNILNQMNITDATDHEDSCPLAADQYPETVA